MFEDSLVESAALLQTHNRWPVVLSMAAQFAAAAALLALPLLHPEALPLARALTTSLAPPRPPAPTPPPMHIRVVDHTTNPRTLPAPINTGTSLPTTAAPPPMGVPADDAPPSPIDMGMRSASLPAGIGSSAPSAPRVTVASPTGRPSAPAHISSGVSAGLLLAPLRPEYPAIARITHTEGTVVIQATISRTGTIESAHVVSGPPVLHQSALDAVVRARYRPYLLNGQPTDVETTFTIHFRMGG